MSKAKKKILILSANPKTTPWLRLDEEVREIKEGLRRSKYRDQFEIYPEFAIRQRDFRRALLDNEPVIVHFIGHGKEEGLILEDEMGMPVVFSANSLSELFELLPKVECVILSACYSELQAKAIGKHIDYVIGMRKNIQDKAAIEFAVGFYDAFCAGKTYEESFEFGCNAIREFNLPEDQVPLLLKKSAMNDDKAARRNVYPDNKPLTVAIQSFKHPSHDIDNQVDEMLCLCDHFQDRKLVKGTWEEVIQKIKDFIYRTIKAEHRYNLYLPLHTSLAFLVGRTLGSKWGAEINIFQPSPSSSYKLWRLKQYNNFKNDNPWNLEESIQGNTANELAAALSVTHSIRADVEAYVKNGCTNISHILHLKLHEIHPGAIRDESHAYSTAYKAVVILREKYRQSGTTKLNLFLAAPNVFTFLLGQQSLLLRNITLYEHNFDSGKTGDYIPVFTL